jgi:hypothetical protein
MSNRAPLTTAEKEQIYQGKLQGKTLAEVAAEVNCSLSCARKWWRRGRTEGVSGLTEQREGRPAKGILSTFEVAVIERALKHKRRHPRWGARRVLVELAKEPTLRGMHLPSASRLAGLFKERCPECVTTPSSLQPVPIRPPRATRVHEIWQLDSQEGIRLADGQIATICNIRDEVGAAFIASCAFGVKTTDHWRKLTLSEVRQVVRTGFTEWCTLPEALMTDNELGLAGNPTDPYPSQLTLWLVGLGVRHLFIRPGCPTDQPQIERGHLMLDNFSFDEASLLNLATLQQTLDREREQYLRHFPSRASDCAGRPPLVAHPELCQPRRLYQPEQELALFNHQHVADYLATFTFQRKVSVTGQVSLGGYIYSFGRTYAGQDVFVRFDARTWQWVMLTKTETNEPGQELTRRPPKGLDVETLTGLDPQTYQLTAPVQLMLPCFLT